MSVATLTEFIDVGLVAIAIQVVKMGNAAFLGPLFGRFVTFQGTYSFYPTCSIGAILSVEMLQFLSKFNATLLGLGLIFINPLVLNAFKETIFELGPVEGPALSSSLLLLATFLLQNASCRSLTTGKRSFIKSAAALAMLLYFEKFGFNTFQLLCCDLNRASLLLVVISLFLTNRRYTFILLLLALSVLSTNIYQGFNVRQCLPPSTDRHAFNKNLTIYARAESITGFVSVVETTSAYGKILLMKCDHSILGGQYLEYQRDSIFGVFYCMDFVRFVKTDIRHHQRALVIGLGIGVSAKTLIDSGIDVDVVEIDPVLYSYAQLYFDMPKPKKAYLQDARKFMENHSSPVYDYILHDIFSGGIVSPSLFSVEALVLAKRLLLPNGVLVVNFVGKIDSLASKSVTATLQTVFKNVLSIPEDENVVEVQNILYFASNHGDAIEFDFNQDTSFTDSTTYRHTLTKFQTQAKFVPEKVDPFFAILDKSNPLESEQYSSAILHFDIVGRIFNNKYFWTELF
jgi:hypothetical protein